MLQWLYLGGDGDEVDAIDRVERLFGIYFDHEDCEQFVTVGDVWRSLLKELKTGEAEAQERWPSFVRALGEETLREKDFARVGLETRLLGPTLDECCGRH